MIGASVEPNWTKGYSLDTLKRLAQPFKALHKRHIYGAFGLVKERDIATALANQELHYTDDDGTNPPGAIAIAGIAKHKCRRKAFSGRLIEVPAGAMVIDAFAASSWSHAMRLLQSIAGEANGKPIFAEIFEEDRLVKAALVGFGLTWIDTKITAGAEIKGLYGLGLDIPEQRDEAELASLSVISPGYASIGPALEEAQAAGEFAQHYSSYNKRGTWTALSLRGYSIDPQDIIRPDEMAKSWKESNPQRLDDRPVDTPLRERCPYLSRLAETIPGRKDRIRLMKLAPKGGELTRHADITLRDAGVADGKIARLHIPLKTNDGVEFRQWDARGTCIKAHLAAGSLCYLDQRKPHAAINQGDDERIHLVIDVESGPELRQWIKDAEA